MRKVLVDREWLKRLHRDLDACQKVIWLGLRGADPAYCQDAQDRLKEIDELLAQPAEAEGVDVRKIVVDSLVGMIAGVTRMIPPADQPLPDFIQAPVDRAVERINAALSAVTAERDRLQAALSAPDTITAEPAGDYDNLRKQFQSLRMLANSNAKMVHHWRAQCGRETRETLLANAASVNAERDTNSMLTDALETAERERDQLRAEIEALRKDAERWRYVSLQGDDTHWLNLLRVDLDEFGGNINAAVDALIDGEAPSMAAKEA